jgi:hypothetical protein
MDELTFRLIYAVFGAALLGILMFLLTRGMDRKTYLRPVLYGFFFALGGYLIFGAGIVALMLGGIIVGYMLGGKVRSGWLRFRAGGLSAVLVLIALFLPGSHLFIQGSGYGVFTHRLSDILAALSSAVGETVSAGALLYSLLMAVFFTTFLIIAVVGVGALLGGYLYRFLAPPQESA